MSRCGKFFNGEAFWVYWCSCDRATAEHMDSLSSKMDNNYDNVKSLLPCCSHITAIKDILERIDAVNGITADTDVTGVIRMYIIRYIHIPRLIHVLLVCIYMWMDHE